MEAGAKGSGALQLIHTEDSKIPEWQDAYRIVSLSFRRKREFLPLQAADIFAYELYKQSARVFGQEKRPVRYPLTQLARKKHQWNYVHDQHLREFNEDMTRQLLAARGDPSSL